VAGQGVGTPRTSAMHLLINDSFLVEINRRTPAEGLDMEFAVRQAVIGKGFGQGGER
jgi:hypothetical protein